MQTVGTIVVILGGITGLVYAAFRFTWERADRKRAEEDRVRESVDRLQASRATEQAERVAELEAEEAARPKLETFNLVDMQREIDEVGDARGRGPRAWRASGPGMAQMRSEWLMVGVLLLVVVVVALMFLL